MITWSWPEIREDAVAAGRARAWATPSAAAFNAEASALDSLVVADEYVQRAITHHDDVAAVVLFEAASELQAAARDLFSEAGFIDVHSIGP